MRPPLRSAGTGIRFTLALCLRARYMVAPDAPGASAAADEARSILTDLGAVTLLRGLPVVDQVATASPGRAAASPGHVAQHD